MTNEKMAVQIMEKEYIHRDFTSLLNIFFTRSKDKPILLKGPVDCGKKTMVRMLVDGVGITPKIYNFSNSTINNEPYFDQRILMHNIKRSQAQGECIIIEDLEKLDTYDSVMLSRFIQGLDQTKNPRSVIIILENANQPLFKSFSDDIRKKCVTVTVTNDPVIDEKIRKAKKAKQKIKTMKDVK